MHKRSIHMYCKSSHSKATKASLNVLGRQDSGLPLDKSVSVEALSVRSRSQDLFPQQWLSARYFDPGSTSSRRTKRKLFFSPLVCSFRRRVGIKVDWTLHRKCLSSQLRIQCWMVAHVLGASENSEIMLLKCRWIAAESS